LVSKIEENSEIISFEYNNKSDIVNILFYNSDTKEIKNRAFSIERGDDPSLQNLKLLLKGSLILQEQVDEK